MTNKEAIEILDKGIIIDGEAIRSTGYREWCDMLAAIKMGRDALREKAEKERRFVVRADQKTRTYQVHENDGFYGIVAYYCKNVEQAQRIADIYEETYQ